ncbi:MAG TPA: ABC transporter substrate-binding protein [Ottowia sp.]|uniref:ABC transporter substrate-binding protein n=1 Tax=Ottowia sp. TaxID=1898956 RepID=UPI002C2E3D89|nr:ABC transporter substrate-binding protein [Ottowia sp.]HMN21337.1 ABC transporter substrate-binding protein [Ottowia sp.]
MNHRTRFGQWALLAGLLLGGGLVQAQGQPPIKIGVNAAIQVQAGRDIRDGAQLAVDEINAKGGVLGRQLAMVVADETEDPEKGISAIKKLIADDKADVLIGGYTSGVTLAQLPHITRAKTLSIVVGAASPAITAKVKQDYETNKYIFRTGVLNSLHLANGVLGYMTGFLHDELGMNKFAIVGESAKWVQDLLPFLKKNAEAKGLEIVLAETFDTGTTNFSPLLSKVKNSGAQYMIVILSHASSDILAKQWYDARVPVPYGGIDVKSQDTDFFERVGGKSISEVAFNFIVRAPLSERTLPFFDAFEQRYKREPVYTGSGAYDAVHAYADAVTRAGSLDTDAVIKALEKIDMPATTGRIQLDDNHDLKGGEGLVNLLFVQWQEGGKRVIVWPKSARTGTYINPPWMQ